MNSNKYCLTDDAHFSTNLNFKGVLSQMTSKIPAIFLKYLDDCYRLVNMHFLLNLFYIEMMIINN
jgi:hypothetical protein